MRVNGTLMNYYFHCKRQCYLHGNRLNLEDNSEEVQIGKALHEEKAQNENFDVILSDVMLPGLEGFQLVRKLREKKIATPVLFMTARVELPREICRFLLP